MARHAQRNEVLGQAFESLDTDGKGFIEDECLIEAWSYSKVPIKSTDITKGDLSFHTV